MMKSSQPAFAQPLSSRSRNRSKTTWKRITKNTIMKKMISSDHRNSPKLMSRARLPSTVLIEVPPLSVRLTRLPRLLARLGAPDGPEGMIRGAAGADQSRAIAAARCASTSM